MKRRCYFVYIVASKSRVLYIGMTNSLDRRIWEHENDLVDGFSKQYRCHRLVYYESFDDVKKAIDREKQLKRWNRRKKVWLIERTNPTWEDLAEGLEGQHRYTPEQQVPPLAS
jgi:putative endonuclease